MPCSYVTVVAAVDVAAVAVGTIALLVQILSGRLALQSAAGDSIVVVVIFKRWEKKIDFKF